MNKLFLLLLLPAIVLADDMDEALKRSLSPENVMKNFAKDMRTKAQWQRVLGNNTGADINQALADSISKDKPTEENPSELTQLRAEVESMKKEIAELRAFCVKSAQIIRELKNARLERN